MKKNEEIKKQSKSKKNEKTKRENKPKKNKKDMLEDTQTKLKKIENITKEIKKEQHENNKKLEKNDTESKKNILDKGNIESNNNTDTNNSVQNLDINKMKKNKNKNKKKNSIKLKISEFISLIIIVLLISALIGYKIGRRDTKQVVLDENLQQFIDVYNNVKENYYSEIDDESLIADAVEGMLEGLDDYSLYFDENNASTFNAKLSGEYEGLGVEIIQYSDEIIVYNVFKDSPAEKAGIKVADVITKIDGESISGKATSDISKYIMENEKEEFDIEVRRKDETLNFKLTRGKVIINSVSSKIYESENKKIGYIYIGIFSNTAYSQFKEELQKLEKQNIDSLIIDVRDNTGGHLTTAVNILSLFLNSDKIIYQIEKQDEVTKYYSIGKRNVEYPIVILQNFNSASASELLSITLKEQANATIIGENSYGKGTVQELITLSDGTEYKITTKKWLSPNGIWINGVGIKPDIEVTLNEDYYLNPTDENDNQLQKAIEYLK